MQAHFEPICSDGSGPACCGASIRLDSEAHALLLRLLDGDRDRMTAVELDQAHALMAVLRSNDTATITKEN